MRLPHAENAQIPLEKLVGYALDPNHKDGRNKARVFKARLGFIRGDSETVSLLIKNLVPFFDANERETDDWGTRYQVDIPLTGRSGKATVRTGWIIPVDSDTPSLTTAFVLPDDDTKAQ
jgi:hypothetical protein